MSAPSLMEIENLARQAGEILRGGYGKQHQIGYKGKIDLVTEMDHQSEAFILQEIQSRHPSHAIMAEESGSLSGTSPDLWIVDPLDGTVNYAHGIPIFCVSIAYAHQGQVQMGVVYDPMRDEMFSAERGKGARLNGQTIGVSDASEMVHALLVTGFPYGPWETTQKNLENYTNFTRHSQGVRRLGSAALDLCYIASARMDGFWEIKIQPWDIAAGGLIAEEAGAVATKVDGNPNYVETPCSILCANPGIHAQMLTILLDPQTM